MIWGVWLPVAMLLVGLGTQPASAGARNPCLEPGNLTQNCGFDTFADHMEGDKRLQVPSGWGYFILAGDLDFRPAEDTYWGAPSLWMLSDGVPFTAGVYQQVPVAPGVVYQTDIGWAAVTQSDFERKLGLDPTGGTNPQAPTVVWSRSEWGFDKWPDLTVSTRATGPTMTVFVWVAHPTSHGNDWIFLDAVGLWPDSSQPPATMTPRPSLTPTHRPPTRRPPTRTPSPVPLTDTPTPPPASPMPTETTTPTPTPVPTQTPTFTPTPTWTPTASPAPPSVTPLPSRTPLPTLEPVARVVGTPGAEPVTGIEPASGQETAPEMVFLYVALGALVGGILLASAVLWLWGRGRRTDDEQDPKLDED
jgi:hypothetical protein